MYYDRKETRDRSLRGQELTERFIEMIQKGYSLSSKIQKIFQQLNLSPSDFSTLQDIEKLPVINREKLIEMELEKPPFGGFCDDNADIERIFTSPGPVYEPHLNENELWARGYRAAGFKKDDVVLNTFSYHMVAAGLTFHEGLRATGATVVPSGISNTETQLQLIKDLGVTGFAGTPSFLMAVIKKAIEKGYDFKRDFKLRKASFVAEPLPPSLRKVFEEEYGIDTYQMYGATEVGDIAYECVEKDGWHLIEDVIVEIVDPETGKAVKPGELGEVVVTRLNDIFFLFRFATGDLSSVREDLCPCGRTSYRLNGIAGRVGEAVKVRGLFVAPSQLNVLDSQFENVKYQLVITRENHRDILTVILESDEQKEDIRNRFAGIFQKVCTVKIDRIEFAAPGTLSKNAKRIIDKRDWK